MDRSMKEVEFKYITGFPDQVNENLTRSITRFKRLYPSIKIGMTGKNPQDRFVEHLKDREWERMVVIFETNSFYFLKVVARWLHERYPENVEGKRGRIADLTERGNNYVYVLLAQA